MKKLVAGSGAVLVAVTGVVALAWPGQARSTPATTKPAVEPRSVCEARRVGQDVEVSVRLQVTDRQLDMRADDALVVADLGDVTQTRVLRPDERSGAGYAVTFDNLPANTDLSSISVRASRSPDDPASFTCDSSAAAGPTSPAGRRGQLPQSGG